MPKKSEKRSDFRYDTGETAVPWKAVGEPITADDAVLASVAELKQGR